MVYYNEKYYTNKLDRNYDWMVLFIHTMIDGYVEDIKVFCKVCLERNIDLNDCKKWYDGSLIDRVTDFFDCCFLDDKIEYYKIIRHLMTIGITYKKDNMIAVNYHRKLYYDTLTEKDANNDTFLKLTTAGGHNMLYENIIDFIY